MLLSPPQQNTLLGPQVVWGSPCSRGKEVPSKPGQPPPRFLLVPLALLLICVKRRLQAMMVLVAPSLGREMALVGKPPAGKGFIQ